MNEARSSQLLSFGQKRVSCWVRPSWFCGKESSNAFGNDRVPLRIAFGDRKSLYPALGA